MLLYKYLFHITKQDNKTIFFNSIFTNITVARHHDISFRITQALIIEYPEQDHKQLLIENKEM